MKKIMAIVIATIIIGGTIALTGVAVADIAQNGFRQAAIPVMIGGGIAGLSHAVKVMLNRKA